jgi:CRISPR-associated protein Cas5d
MGKGIILHVWGDGAVYSRPELKVERYSYDVITPSAARGILDSILWHPGMEWVIDKIHVIKPIQRASIQRRELKKVISSRNAANMQDISILTSDTSNSTLRYTSYLKQVEYVIEAHFIMTPQAHPSDYDGKFYKMAIRRMSNGQCYKQPYFGCREFPVHFELLRSPEDIPKSYYANTDTYDLGVMLYDMDYQYNKPSTVRKISPIWYHAIMHKGVIDLTNVELLR